MVKVGIFSSTLLSCSLLAKNIEQKLTRKCAGIIPNKNVPARNYSAVSHAMEVHKVVPDVICVPPHDIAEVIWSCDTKAKLGNILRPCFLEKCPIVTWAANKKCFYTLAMIDCDRPSREKRSSEFLHWLLANIPERKLSEACILAEYVPPIPKERTNLHRYAFFVYKQLDFMEFEDFVNIPGNTIKGRCNFSIFDFAEKYFLGDPIAGNIFRAEWDKSVPDYLKTVGLLDKCY